MATSDPLHSLELRIQALHDIDAIETLKHRYWRAIDRKRSDDVRECLVPDSVIDFEGLPRCENREAFLDIVRHASKTAFGMHHGQNPRITLTDENTAEGEWDIFYQGLDNGTITQLAGAYQDLYRRENQRWWITAMRMRVTSLHVQSKGKTLILGK